MSNTFVYVNTAQITQLYDKPLLVLPAPGADLAYLVHDVAFVFYKGTLLPLTPRQDSLLVLQYDSNPRAAGRSVAQVGCIPLLNQPANSFIGASGCREVYSSSETNNALYLTNTIGPIAATTSNATLGLNIWYDTIQVV